MKTNRNEKGIALVMAIIAALLVSISAAIVLNMTYRSFYLSVFQTDHAVGFYAAESGVQYAESRLEFDAVFAAAVKAKGASTTSTPPGQNLPYIVTSLQSGNPVIDGNEVSFFWEGDHAPQLMGDWNGWESKPQSFKRISPRLTPASDRTVWSCTLSPPPTLMLNMPSTIQSHKRDFSTR